MTLGQLRTFALVAKLGSLHAAAAAPRSQRTGSIRGARRAQAGPGRPALCARPWRDCADSRRPGARRTCPGHRGTGGPGPVGGGTCPDRDRAAEDRGDGAVCRARGGPAAGPFHPPGSRGLRRCGGGGSRGHRLAAARTRLRHRPGGQAAARPQRLPCQRHWRRRHRLRPVPAVPADRRGGRRTSARRPPRAGAPAELLGRPWFAGPAGIQAASEEGRWLAAQAWRRRSSG